MRKDETLLNDPEFLKLADEYKDLIDKLNNNTNESLGKKDLMNIIKSRLEPILNAHEVNLPIPDWADADFLEKSEEIGQKEFDFLESCLPSYKRKMNRKKSNMHIR